MKMRIKKIFKQPSRDNKRDQFMERMLGQFDVATAHAMMVLTDWNWDLGGDTHIPTEEEIKDHIHDMVSLGYFLLTKGDRENVTFDAGGFYLQMNRYGDSQITAHLRFVPIERVTSIEL